MSTERFAIGTRWVWRPGLQMDRDTGEVVEIVDRVNDGRCFRVRVLSSDRLLTAYPDELKEEDA